MANIPGINNFTQPGTFARDEVSSRGASVPGGIRVVCVMGEGLREETIVSQAVGNGADGNAACSPTGTGDGRYFSLRNAPVVPGRTELFLNGTILYGIEEAVNLTEFSGDFDFRIDPTTGCIELQKSSIGDQDGKKFSASSLNAGNGVIVDDTCGDTDLISVIDSSAPRERWTVRAIGVIRDSNGDPIPGRTTFTVTGAVSGQLRDSNGQPFLFTDSYYSGSQGAASANADASVDGFIVANSDDFGLGDAVAKSGDQSPLTTDTFTFDGNLISQGQALVGDELCVGSLPGIKIENIEYDSVADVTTITLVTDSLDASVSSEAWNIKATNLFIDDSTVIHNGITGAPASAGGFSSSDVGKVLVICSGLTTGRYRVTDVTSSRRIRIESFEDPLSGFPILADDDTDGLAETGLTFSMLQTNGVLLFGINPGTVPFDVGDKFFIDVNSRVLAQNDTLEAKYIAVLDLNDPQFFLSTNELYTKHGSPSLDSDLSLGAQLAFENGAPGVLALQTKPPLPRRTSVTLLAEETTAGEGGFSACGTGAGADCEIDDLKFIIPRPNIGLRRGRPDGDTQMNLFVVRDGVETQIFANKVPFYNSQLETAVGQQQFITSPDTSFSYTIINTETKVDGIGDDGVGSFASETFTTLEYDFDSDDVGKVIVLQSVEDFAGNKYTSSDAISTLIFGNTTSGVELVIDSISDDSTVTVFSNDGLSTSMIGDFQEAQFFIKDITDTTNTKAALLLHRDLVDSGALQEGDGIKISYIDEVDADFYDANWFDAFEILEREQCQMVVPLPKQNRSGIFRAAINHVNTMSSITIQRERIALIGAQQGVTSAALIGLEEIAVEDIGVLEGIQGDDPNEVLDGNTEDLVNFKLRDNYDEKRLMYFYPDQVVREVRGTNTLIDGYFIAAAAGGWFSGTQNIALPITNKTLTGFSILRNKVERPVTLDLLGAEGVTVLQPVVGGGRILFGRTTSQSGFAEDEEPSIIFIRDAVKKNLRDALRPFIGGVENPNTQGVLSSRVATVMAGLLSRGLITGFSNIKVERDKIEPRQYNAYVRFQPSYPLNWIYIDIEVGVL